MKYSDFNFKVPKESSSYKNDSDLVLKNIKDIIDNRILSDKNKIILNTNLKLGLPIENINKIAGPIVEAWCFEVFNDIKEINNKYNKKDNNLLFDTIKKKKTKIIIYKN